jgi:LSD1 subclass zinc finger protein
VGIKQRSKERAARLVPQKRAPAKAQVAPLSCPACRAPVPLGAGDVAACAHCGTRVPLPEPHRALRDAERQRSEDRAAAEALYQRLGAPPSAALRLWAQAALLAGGALAGFLGLFLTVSSPLLLLSGFALELILHALARLLGVDLIDRFGGGTVYASFAFSLVAFGIGPNWLLGYLDSLAAVRAALQLNLAAVPPQQPGFPSTCRNCGAALDVPPGALGVRCAYCRSDNLVSLPRAWLARLGERLGSFHASIVDAAAQADALRKEQLQVLPDAAKWTVAAIVAFGLLGRGCSALDADRIATTFAASAGPPRQMFAYWKPEMGVPSDALAPFARLTYTVALRRHEVLQWSSPDTGWGGAITVKNSTTFPWITSEETAPWQPQTDGTYAARYRAPYTGLFQVELQTREVSVIDVHLRWRIGADSVDGVPPAPPITVGQEAAAPAPAALPEPARALAERLGARLAVNPPGRSDLLVTSGHRGARQDDIVLTSLSSGEQLVKLGDPVVKVLAVSREGWRMVTASPERTGVWWLEEKPKDSVWRGPLVDSARVTALVFLSPTVFASGDEAGVIKVWSADSGIQLYAMPGSLPGPVTSLSLSTDGTALVAGFAGGARRFVVARPEVWTQHG